MGARMNAAVRTMTSADISAVQHVERAAGERFRESDDPRVARCADDPVFTAEELARFIAAQRAWVATEDGEVVGFIVTEVVDGCAHIDEIAVAPVAGRRGHGTALLEQAQRWAARQQLPAVTLTTFRDVAWNGPWYVKQGFRELADHEWSPAIRALRDEEARKGLAKELRSVMRRDVRREAG
jgi:ribosomal protein S18 acetylase RimI-like enzyme